MDTSGLRRCVTAFSEAEELLESAGQDITRLPDPVRVFMLVHGAQGTIDNGGYKYFFGANWPGCPAYDEFISAYATIGCTEQAAELRRVVSTFPFPDPHLDEELRKQYMARNFDEDSDSVRGWGDALCGDSDVWARLADYYELHKKVFGAPVAKRKPWWRICG